MQTTTREVQLVSRPQGWPADDDFRLVEVELPPLEPGQVLIRNDVMSVDPYMRGRMNDAKSYVPPYALGAAMEGGAVGEVMASRDDSLPVGTPVISQLGWREHAVATGTAVRRIDTAAAPASTYLGVLGMPGLTAYVGLTRIAVFKPGDVVFVSGAAGAVGSVVGQIARNLGAGRVVGSAGSAEKVAYLVDEVGFDAAFDYSTAPLPFSLRRNIPGGIDVYFDNVGGDHLEAALGHMRDFGRIALCGAISQYNAATAPVGPRNFGVTVPRRLLLRGFIVTDHNDLAKEFYATAGGWLKDGTLTARETVVEGLENAVDAFLDLHRGKNIGKMLVRLD